MSSSKPRYGVSDGNGLCNLDYVDRYQEILQTHLPEAFLEFGHFFAGTQRLKTCARLFKEHLHGDALTVLNVGSGPFATEIFVERLQTQRVHSLDYTPEFAPFLVLFQNEALILNTTFEQADAMSVSFEPDSFDLIIIHDVLYETALDMEKLVTHMHRFLKPGGLLFFDFVNTQTEWIWRLLGKPSQFKRYSPSKVRDFLAENDFEILAFVPTHGARSQLVRILHGSLWNIFRASNNYAVLVRNRRET